MSRWMMLRVWADSFASLGNAGPGFAQARTTPPGLKPEYEKMSDVVHGNEIEVYLKDHYAGGIGALELLGDSIEAHAGTPLAAFFAELRGDIKADHDQLHNLMTVLGVADSGARNTSAWL